MAFVEKQNSGDKTMEVIKAKIINEETIGASDETEHFNRH